MVVRQEKAQIQALLREAIPSLCQKGLPADADIFVEGLIGITIGNDDDVMLISIKETIPPAYLQAQDQSLVGTQTNDNGKSDVESEFDGLENDYAYESANAAVSLPVVNSAVKLEELDDKNVHSGATGKDTSGEMQILIPFTEGKEHVQLPVKVGSL